MGDGNDLLLYYAPHTRSSATLTLLEELGASFELRLLDFKGGEQRQPGYLAVNPMGKVPAIVYQGQLVTEQVAIALFLADLFPAAGLAPALTDPARGPYLRWLVFYAACFEPAVADRALQRDSGRPSMSPYGDYETVMRVVNAQIAQGPWLLGETFTAADVVWGSALHWTTGFGVVPVTPGIAAYLERFNARPAVARAVQRDTTLLAEQDAAAGRTTG